MREPVGYVPIFYSYIAPRNGYYGLPRSARG